MSDKTAIEWTDATWNPIRGVRGLWSCTKVSPGCAHCYAETMNVRFGGPRYVAGADDLRLDEKVLTQPLRWRRPRRVFVCSMTDLFEERVKDEWIEAIWTTMGRAQTHAFQVLTKRPQRMRRFVEANLGCTLPNVWIGVSVEDQRRADERIPLLQQTPAAVRFVSVEPLLGPVNLAPYVHAFTADHDGPCCEYPRGLMHWVIVGGESGPGARPCDLAWIRSIRNQCRAAGVACFVKQLGSRPFWTNPEARSEFDQGAGPYEVAGKGGDPSEWPADLRVREWPA